MRSFIRAHLDPVDRLGEVVFSLVMALGFIGACRLELSEPDNRSMLIGVFGCNLAWGIVDGVMFVFAALFQRGLQARLIRNVQNSTSKDDAMRHVATEFGDRLDDLTTSEDRTRIYQGIIEFSRRAPPATRARVRRQDIFGGIAVTILIVVATIPVVLPFIFVPSPVAALRWASGIALVLLFLVGCWWGRMVGVSGLRIGTGLTVFGIILVIITIALGG
jgi:hypothetical protein